MGKTISVVIITKNEENMIANAITCARFADEIIVVDSGSSDNTREIAKKEGAVVVEERGGTFKDWRNRGLAEAKGDWVFFLDADERISKRLANEIQEQIRLTSNTVFLVNRHNIHFGQWMRAGGWEHDSLERLFLRSTLQGFEGSVHESAFATGARGCLKEPLIHFTHRSLRDCLLKSSDWTPIEAGLLFEAHAARVTGVTLIRKSVMEFLRRFIFKRGYRDGIVGLIESMQQAINRFFVYAQLWELQQKPSISEKYRRFEKELIKQIK